MSAQPDKSTGHFVPLGRPFAVRIPPGDDECPPNYFGPFAGYPAAYEFAAEVDERLGRGFEVFVMWDPRDGEALR